MKDVKNNLESDRVVLEVPKDKVEAVVSVAPGQANVSSSEVTTDVVNPLPTDLGILDTDYSNSMNPVIVVGGPCANTVAAQLMGNPQNCAEGFQQGYGLIKLFPDKDALLVAGYSASDTQAAVEVLENYDQHLSDLQGKTEVRVVSSTKSITTVEQGNSTGNNTNNS